MNSHLPLAEPLSYDRLSPELLRLDPRQAMEVLQKFEENMSTIRDPHSWVSSAARRLIERSSGAEDRLMKRITWLNANVSLSSPLDYDQVAGSLLRLEIQQAMTVLKNLEENASTVLDPVAYVTTAVDNARMVSTVTLSSAGTSHQGPAVGMELPREHGPAGRAPRRRHTGTAGLRQEREPAEPAAGGQDLGMHGHPGSRQGPNREVHGDPARSKLHAVYAAPLPVSRRPLAAGVDRGPSLHGHQPEPRVRGSEAPRRGQRRAPYDQGLRQVQWRPALLLARHQALAGEEPPGGTQELLHSLG